MKKYWFVLLMIVCAIALPSCDDDDNDVAETYKEWKEENEAFMEALLYNSEYTRLQSESKMGYIYYKVLEESNGIKPLYTDSIRIYYKGSLISGDVFDKVLAPYQSPYPAFTKDFIDGFTTALQHMNEGAKWSVWIPQELGYGSTGSYNSTTGVYSIKPYSALNFEIELVEVIRK